MELIKAHISSCLLSFTNESPNTCDVNLNAIQNDFKDDFTELIYVSISDKGAFQLEKSSK